MTDHDGVPEPTRHRPTWVEVDLAAVRDNVAALNAHATDAQVMAVVKADGYGHGAVPVAQAALDGGATWLGVALVEEGVTLRTAGITAPILVMSEPPGAAAPTLLAHDLTPTIYSETFVAALIAATADGAVTDVHLKLDTGMRRVGLAPADWPEAFDKLATDGRVRVAGIWSHLAVADEPDNPFTQVQAERFADGVAMARAAGLRPDLVHLCNSGGTTLSPDLHHDLVRPGIAIYGLEAAPGVRLRGLRPALSLRTELSMVKAVAPGDTVSYGRRWTAQVPTVVGTIPVGYADGVRRGLSNIGEVTHDGRRHPMIGTICMDQMLINLGPDSAARVADPVWLIGGPGPNPVTAADWARWLNTITYEVTCGLGKRIPRIHT